MLLVLHLPRDLLVSVHMLECVLPSAISSCSCTYLCACSSINIITFLSLYFAMPLPITWVVDLAATMASILLMIEDHLG